MWLLKFRSVTKENYFVCDSYQKLKEFIEKCKLTKLSEFNYYFIEDDEIVLVTVYLANEI